MVERALQVAEACVEDMSEYCKFLHKGIQTCQVAMQSKDILGNIYYFRVCSYTEQIALINYLDKFISDHRDVSTLIVFYPIFISRYLHFILCKNGFTGGF